MYHHFVDLETAVTLSNTGEPGSTYINANYIKVICIHLVNFKQKLYNRHSAEFCNGNHQSVCIECNCVLPYFLAEVCCWMQQLSSLITSVYS